jgi:hypothetical protein
MEYEATVPPPEGSIVYPVIALLTGLDSEAEEIVNAGAATTAGVFVLTTGAVPVLITGVASEAAELPSTLTAAIVNV